MKYQDNKNKIIGITIAIAALLVFLIGSIFLLYRFFYTPYEHNNINNMQTQKKQHKTPNEFNIIKGDEITEQDFWVDEKFKTGATFISPEDLERKEIWEKAINFYADFIKNLPQDNIKSVIQAANAYNYYSKHIKDKQINDKLFAEFFVLENNIKLIELEKLFERDDLTKLSQYFSSEKLNNIKILSQKEKVKWALKGGLKLKNIDNSYCLIWDPDYDLNLFESTVSDETIEFLEIFRDVLLMEPFVFEGKITSNWDEIASTAVKIEKFLNNKEISGDLSILDQKRKKLFELYIMEYPDVRRTPKFPNGKLDKDLLRSYEMFVEKYPNSEMMKLVKEYLDVLKADSYLYTNNVEKFLIEHNFYNDKAKIFLEEYKTKNSNSILSSNSDLIKKIPGQIVKVNDSKELERVISSNKVIELKGGNYVLNSGIEIRNMTNILIKAEDGKTSTISTRYSSGSIFSLKNCNNIGFQNINFSLDKNSNDGCLYFENSGSIYLSSCNINGSGNYGIKTKNVNVMEILNSSVSNFSDNALDFSNTTSVNISDSKIFRNKGSCINFKDSSEITLNRIEITDNDCLSIFNINSSNELTLSDSKIEKNKASKLQSGNSYIDLVNCKITNNNGF